MMHRLGRPSRPARPLSCENPSKLLGASQWTILHDTKDMH